MLAGWMGELVLKWYVDMSACFQSCNEHSCLVS